MVIMQRYMIGVGQSSIPGCSTVSSRAALRLHGGIYLYRVVFLALQASQKYVSDTELFHPDWVFYRRRSK